MHIAVAAPPSAARVIGALLVSIVGISCAAPIVRLSHSPPLTITIWRMFFSLLLVGLALAWTGQWREWRSVSPRLLGWSLLAGSLLAVHFWSWSASLGYTSVAASVVLVSLQPILVLPIADRWLGERASPAQRGGVILAVVGAIVVALGDGFGGLLGGVSSSRALFGDLLAAVGGVAGAGYFLIGRRVRPHLSLWSYVGVLYGACLLVLLAAATVSSAPIWPVSSRELLLFAGLAVGPMLFGHTILNWALGHAPAHLVNVAVLGEPVGATLLAWVLPAIRERPPLGALVGGAIVVAGLALASARPKSRPMSTAGSGSTG
jgi:drug/metabolite transporter (DMT)-like permease